MAERRTRWIYAGVAIALALAAWFAWNRLNSSEVPEGIAVANGRIEATEIDISALAGARIRTIRADEGDFVSAGDVLVEMDTLQLEAQRRQAEAHLSSARIGVDSARSLVVQAEAQRRAAEAALEQAQAVADAAALRRARSEELVRSNAISQQVLDNDRASDRQARAGIAAAEANLAAADAQVGASQAQVINAEAAVAAAAAAIEAIAISIDDSTLTSPRNGRVQYRVAQEGEIVAAGGRILNLVDLGDVYMTVFLPTSEAGRVRIGTQVRLVLDAAPGYVIPATVSYVADVAQFTPKTVETADEREKLMFRVRARIDRELLTKYLEYVKTGLPGLAYVQLDPEASWPEFAGEIAE